MRKRMYNWQGQGFVYLGFEGEPGKTAEQQSRGLFERAAAELKSLGLSLDKNVVRNRVFGRTREARDVVSAVRGKTFSGQSRAATSSFIRCSSQRAERLRHQQSPELTAPGTRLSRPRWGRAPC